MLEFKGVKSHRGFDLQNKLIFNSKLIVLTGKNGSGKTRFLEGVSNGSIAVCREGEHIDTPSVKMIEHKALLPQIHPGYDENFRKNKVRSLQQILLESKEKLDEPLKVGAENQQAMMAGRAYRNQGVALPDAYRILSGIAKKLEKQPSQLTNSEIDCYYDEYQGVTFGAYSVGAIFNDYMKRREDNLYHMWLKERRGRDDIYCVPEDKFESEFGGPPWVSLNLILDEAFGGKFKFSEPGAEYDPSFQTVLISLADGTPLDPNDLSSGEKTLLWIVLTVFNARPSVLGGTQLPKLLLIDEPDAFLHPSMVLSMMRCFEALNNVFDIDIVITTHSPTTVALASDDSIYVMDKDSIRKIDQDAAISELLDGITQISINPHNRRQVYVESSNDVDIFERIYRGVARRDGLLDPKVSLSFVSAGMKLPQNLVAEKLKEFFGDLDPEKVDLYTKSVNGVGGCNFVKGAVDYLSEAGSTTVRGLIDRDVKNEAYGYVHVLGGGICYAIENLAFDPICVSLQVHLLDGDRFSMEEICGADVTFRTWLKDDGLLQESVNRYIESVLKRPNREDITYKYVGGKTIQTDSEYLSHHGHQLWPKIESSYDVLKKFGRSEDGVKAEIVKLSMLGATEGDFIPCLFVDAFLALQK